MPTAGELREPPVALARRRSEVMCFINDDQRSAARRLTATQGFVTMDTHRDLGALGRTPPLLAYGRGREHQHILILGGDSQREHGLAASHGISHQRAAVTIERVLNRPHAEPLPLTQREVTDLKRLRTREHGGRDAPAHRVERGQS